MALRRVEAQFYSLGFGLGLGAYGLGLEGPGNGLEGPAYGLGLERCVDDFWHRVSE